ncbi:Uncharacterised protein [Shigella sonnei]|nr:Uncharacterised protein [Shigella sonnei]
MIEHFSNGSGIMIFKHHGSCDADGVDHNAVRTDMTRAIHCRTDILCQPFPVQRNAPRFPEAQCVIAQRIGNFITCPQTKHFAGRIVKRLKTN